MSHASTHSDPRALVTPDAFEVSAELLGLPLAPPGRRLAAILIDLVVIGVLIVVTRSFALLLGVAVAVAFIRVAFTRTPVRGGVFGRAMRLSVGCLGVFIAALTATLWVAFGIGGSGGRPDPGRANEIMADIDPDVTDALEAAGVVVPGLPSGPGRIDTTAASDSVRALVRQLAARELEIAALTEAVEAASSEGFFARLGDFVDELGFGFGWASLYMTVLLTAWKGQTVGKRLLGLRVLRLDGEPITWWLAFERAGGYAAGFATGLLGFAQVYWDANRQAIHDRIAGTVVVVDGAERIGNWHAAHT